MSRLACLLRSSFARETEMKPAAGGRERPGRSLHTHSVSLKHQIGVPRSILPSESGHRSSPRRARQRQHEHRTAMRHVVVHVAFFRTSCARGGGRASALKAGVESRPLSPSRTSRRRSSPTCTSRAPRGGPPRGAGREVGSAVGSTCDGFFLGTDSTLQTRPQNGARPCAIMHLWLARSRIWKARALSTIERTQTQGIRGHAGYSLNSLSAGSVRHESCQLIRHVRDHTLSPSLGASHVARAAGCGGAVNA